MPNVQSKIWLVHGSISSFVRSVTIACVVVVILAPPDIAQSVVIPNVFFPPAVVSVPDVKKEVTEVSMVLTVTDGRGHLIHNLRESDFNILDNGHAPDRITYFEAQTNLPLKVALVVDTSDSVNYRFKFEQKSGATFFRHMLHSPADLGAVVGFNQDVRVAQTLTRNTDALKLSLKHLHPGGETAIYDAVIVAAHELSALSEELPSRHVIVLITDGEDNRSHAHLNDAIEAALRSDSVVYVVSTNSTDLRFDFDDEGDAYMTQLAQATGGRLLHSEDEGDVATAFSRIEKELRSQYAIAYKPANQSPDGFFHHVMVLSPKMLHVFHRVGYFAR